MKVLVTGATGRVGGEVVKALLQRRADVRALTRKQPEPGTFPETGYFAQNERRLKHALTGLGVYPIPAGNQGNDLLSMRSTRSETGEISMKFSIIGSGEIGTALARAFARKKIEVAIANSRGPATLASLTEELGPNVVPQSVQNACEAEMIFLAVPFSAHQDVAKQFEQWNGKIIVDVTNTFHVGPEELGALLSSEVVAQAFVGARLVKAFNHLPAAELGTNPSVKGQRQVVFVSSNDPDASAAVSTVATQLGFAPVELGRLDEGGVPLHVVGGQPGGLLFQNLEKLG